MPLLLTYLCVYGPLHLTNVAYMSVGGEFLWYILILGDHRVLKGLSLGLLEDPWDGATL